MTARKSRRMRKVFKLLAHRALFPAAEGAWAMAFLVVGRLARPRVERYIPGGSERVLVIAPHPDDETLGCGGTTAMHCRAGDSVCVLIVTDGGSSRAGGHSREEMRSLRRREAAAALPRLGPVDLDQLQLPEGRWAPGDLVTPLAANLQSFRPTLVYATSCVDFHPEHLKVARAVAQALSIAQNESCRAVRAYELQVPLTPVLANVAVDISAVADLKERALAEYTTQAGSFAWVPRHARYLRALYGSRGSIEVFWELDPLRYQRLMQACSDSGSTFRSIRLRPFSDGLAWFKGMRARRSLKRLTES